MCNRNDRTDSEKYLSDLHTVKKLYNNFLNYSINFHLVALYKHNTVSECTPHMSCGQWLRWLLWLQAGEEAGATLWESILCTDRNSKPHAEVWCGVVWCGQ